MSLALFFALAVAASPQTAPQTPVPDGQLVPPASSTPPEPTTPEEEAQLSEQVCRSEIVVGTRFNSRVCMTRREWNQRRDDSRRLAQRLESQNGRRGAPALATTTGR